MHAEVSDRPTTARSTVLLPRRHVLRVCAGAPLTVASGRFGDGGITSSCLQPVKQAPRTTTDRHSLVGGCPSPLGGTPAVVRRRSCGRRRVERRRLPVAHDHPVDHDPTELLAACSRGHGDRVGQRQDPRSGGIEGEDRVTVRVLGEDEPCRVPRARHPETRFLATTAPRGSGLPAHSRRSVPSDRECDPRSQEHEEDRADREQ